MLTLVYVFTTGALLDSLSERTDNGCEAVGSQLEPSVALSHGWSSGDGHNDSGGGVGVGVTERLRAAEDELEFITTGGVN